MQIGIEDNTKIWTFFKKIKIKIKMKEEEIKELVADPWILEK